MIRVRVLIFALLFAILGSPIAAIASSVANSLYSGTIIISNNSTATTNVATTANISTSNLIAGQYLNTTANNTVMRNSSGADVPFMPGYTDANLWSMWVPSIGANSYLTYILYTANSTGGLIRYFPGAGGMTTTDNASLELSDNFTIEQKGWVDTDAGADKNLVYKHGAFTTAISANENITSYIVGVESANVTPVVFAAWTEIDVSGYIVAGATGVALHLDANAKECGFRKNGSTDDRRSDMYQNWPMIGVDSNGIFQAYLEDNTVTLYLVGYTTSSWTFKTNADDVSLGAFGAWTDIDVSVEAPGSVGVVVEVENLFAGGAAGGIRMNGSADDRRGDLANLSHFYTVVGVDGANIFEGWAVADSINHYLIGYVTADATFNANGVDKSLVGVGAWTDIDCSVQAPGATHLIFDVYGSAGTDWGLRRNGSPEDVYEISGGLHSWAVVPCDGGQVIEGKIANVATDFWLVGYITDDVMSPVAVSVTASGISSGNMTVTTTANVTHLAIYVDGGLKDSTALTANVTDNSENWTFCEGAAMPYVEYQKISVNGTLQQDIEWRYGDTFYDSSYYGGEFDGVDDTLIIPHDANQLLTTGGSIEAWIYPTGWGETNRGTIVDKSVNTAAGDGYKYFLNNLGMVGLQINSGLGVYSAVGSIVLNNRYYVVVTWDNIGLSTLYVDGVQSGVPGISADPSGITTVSALTVGNRSGATDRTFDGTIDEVRIYNRVLALPEVEANYNSGLGTYTPYDTTGLVGWWHMEEGTGVTTTDSSGNGNTGTLTNGPRWVDGIVPLPPTEIGTNPATPTFRSASSDPDVSANLTSFLPISQAKAPAWSLGLVNPFLSDTSGNLTGNFTTGIPTAPEDAFPLAGVIITIANATATPPQLPLLLLAGFIILAASMTTSGLMRRYGSGTLMVKSFVIIGVMGVFIGIGDFGIDFWMLIIFGIMATALAMMSREGALR